MSKEWSLSDVLARVITATGVTSFAVVLNEAKTVRNRYFWYAAVVAITTEDIAEQDIFQAIDHKWLSEDTTYQEP